MLPEIIFDLLFGDPVPGHDFGVFDAERNQRRAAAETADVEMAHAVMHLDHFGQRRQCLLATIAGSMNRQEAVDAEDCHRAFLRLKAKLDMVGLPGAILLVLAEAHGVFSRPAESRTVRVAWITAANRDENQPYRAADGRVGTKARSEHTRVAIDVELFSNRSVEQERRADVAGGRLHAVKIETRLADRFDGGDNDWQILRQAAGHD